MTEWIKTHENKEFNEKKENHEAVRQNFIRLHTINASKPGNMLEPEDLKGDLENMQSKFLGVHRLLEQQEEPLEKKDLIDVQISASKIPPRAGVKARKLPNIQGEWYLWGSDLPGGSPMEISDPLVKRFAACFATALKDQNVKGCNAASFSMFLWSPKQWTDLFIGPHVDDSWVGEKFIIGNIDGKEYTGGLWSATGIVKDLPRFIGRAAIRVPSQYTVEGEQRWSVAHGVHFPGMDANVRKYRLGLLAKPETTAAPGNNTKQRTVWKYKGRSKKWQAELMRPVDKG